MNRTEEFNWEDVIGISQYDGEFPCVQIKYSEEYSKACSLLRAVIKSGEMSPRVLALTQDIIDMNASHVTAWSYRLSTLEKVGHKAITQEHWLLTVLAEEKEEVTTGEATKDIHQGCTIEDYHWLNNTTLKTSKNYQIWHYRQCLKPAASSSKFAALYFSMEKFITLEILSKDTKNYHAWSHLHWIISQQPMKTKALLIKELEFTNTFLTLDIYNNSAWSYRYFIMCLLKSLNMSPLVHDTEFKYCQNSISKAPQNEAPWNYVFALSENGIVTSDQLLHLCQVYTAITEDSNSVQSTHALEILAELYKNCDQINQARKALELLQKFIPMRKGYWHYKLSQLEII